MAALPAAEIEDRALFERALSSGISLFLGSGFAKLSSSSLGVLPLGSEFEAELRSKFSHMNLPINLDLSTISTIIKSQQSQAFRDFCTERFSVKTFDEKYNSLFRLNVRNVFTTNIDNLVPILVDNIRDRYIHDVFLAGSGPSDARSVSYFALHGCVNHGQRDYLFGTTEIASAYGSDPQLWNHFAQVLATSPTLFWGYGMRDAGTLQAIQSAARTTRSAKQQAWILLSHSERPNEAYYRALNLSPIYGDTSTLLDYLAGFSSIDGDNEASTFSAAQLPEYRIPAANAVPVREASVFFEGADPTWYDIFQNIPAQTSHFRKINNLIASGKDILIQGVAASGKTTLLRMLANSQQDARDYILFISGYMETEKAKIIRNLVGNQRVIVFWDNVFDTTEAVSIIQSIPNAQLVAADRDYIYQFGYHRINVSNLELYDCSDLLARDIQEIIKKIPQPMRNLGRVREVERTPESVSVFDVIQSISHNTNISARIRKIFTDLSAEDDIYKELFVLISYFHNARVPASFDAVASYVGLSGYGVLEVHSIIQRLAGLVKEYEGAFAAEDQDYFSARSLVFAEACMAAAPPAVLKKVISRVLRDISVVKIPYYSVFQRGAFRNELFAKAFPSWQEGLDLYELMVDVALTDRPKPYIKQQCALYLAQKGQFGDAFAMIDEAVRMSRGRIPTIRHTQARIKFEANIDLPDDDTGYIYDSLLDSMKVLEDCRQLDIRKQRHSEYFAKFAIRMNDKYFNNDTSELIVKAEKWLAEEVEKPGFKRHLSRLLLDVRGRIGSELR